MDAPPGEQQRTERSRADRKLLDQRGIDSRALENLGDFVLHVTDVIPFDDEGYVIRARFPRLRDRRPILIRHDQTTSNPCAAGLRETPHP